MKSSTSRKNRCYVDTSALISFLDKSDAHHHLFAHLFADPPPLVSTALVIAEGQAWFLRRYDTSRGLEFMNFIESLKPLILEPVGTDYVKPATLYLRRFSDQDLTFADAVGLVVMDRLKIRSCWSTDRHLALTGITLAIHQ